MDANKRKPPVEHQFKPGQSGNPAGRPPGRKANAPHFFDETIRIEVGGKRQTITRGEHLLQYAEKLAIGKRNAAIGQTLLACKRSVERAWDKSNRKSTTILSDAWDITQSVQCLDDALRSLDIVRLLYRFKRTARMRISPWAVTMALKRIDAEDKKLTRAEQEIVLRATRSPRQVNWPSWWDKDLRGEKDKDCGGAADLQ